VLAGQLAPSPVLSALKHFEDEFLTHIKEARCPPPVARCWCGRGGRCGQRLPGPTSTCQPYPCADRPRRMPRRWPLHAMPTLPLDLRPCFAPPSAKRCRRGDIGRADLPSASQALHGPGPRVRCLMAAAQAGAAEARQRAVSGRRAIGCRGPCGSASAATTSPSSSACR